MSKAAFSVDTYLTSDNVISRNSLDVDDVTTDMVNLSVVEVHPPPPLDDVVDPNYSGPNPNYSIPNNYDYSQYCSSYPTYPP